MSTQVLERRFAAIGARLKLVGPPLGSPRIDVNGGMQPVAHGLNGTRRIRVDHQAISQRFARFFCHQIENVRHKLF